MQRYGKYCPIALMLLELAQGCTATLAAELPATATFPTQANTAALNTGASLQSNSTTDLVPAEQAFHPDAFVEADGSITLLWDYPPNFYLYHKSLAVLHADGTAVALELPEPTVITDEYFGEVEVWFDRLQARVPQTELNAAPGATVELQLKFQGCAQNLYCYPPQQLTLTLQLPD